MYTDLYLLNLCGVSVRFCQVPSYRKRFSDHVTRVLLKIINYGLEGRSSIPGRYRTFHGSDIRASVSFVSSE